MKHLFSILPTALALLAWHVAEGDDKDEAAPEGKTKKNARGKVN